jgi:drug/metabolite transporter (DMT)-like permease
MVLGSALGYATLPTLARVTFDHGADPLGVLALRFALAAPVLGVWVLLRHDADALRRAAPLILPATGLYFLQTLTFFEAIAEMGAVLSVLLLFSYPLVVAATAGFVLDERVSAPILAIVAAGSVGVGLSVGFGGRLTLLGVLLASASSLLFAAFFLIVKRAMSTTGIDGVGVTVLVYVFCALGFPLLAVVAGGSLPDDGDGWLAALTMALVATLAASLLLFSGLRHLSATAAGLVSAAEPTIAVAIAAIALGEGVTAVQVGGMALVAASIGALAFLPDAEQPTPPVP